jgi:hypothetical protein
LQSRWCFRQPPPSIVAARLLQVSTHASERSFLRLEPELDQAAFVQGAASLAYG